MAQASQSAVHPQAQRHSSDPAPATPYRFEVRRAVLICASIECVLSDVHTSSDGHCADDTFRPFRLRADELTNEDAASRLPARQIRLAHEAEELPRLLAVHNQVGVLQLQPENAHPYKDVCRWRRTNAWEDCRIIWHSRRSNLDRKQPMLGCWKPPSPIKSSRKDMAFARAAA
eukprot:CAMPEP_0174695362 /NCGR_PEP_ID=MMETSP1094-20130205/1749_1 /TAXON_ID=156173 /ORGANISM="Chrysochromulina brevifilum, Strain UTEX LB 985" /LENGTH=172 /DNA_ID=CAMNT_0015891835 /DNA_START=147 /DNA_END=666 /DNA_ORIENTATION=-